MLKGSRWLSALFVMSTALQQLNGASLSSNELDELERMLSSEIEQEQSPSHAPTTIFNLDGSWQDVLDGSWQEILDRYGGQIPSQTAANRPGSSIGSLTHRRLPSQPHQYESPEEIAIIRRGIELNKVRDALNRQGNINLSDPKDPRVLPYHNHLTPEEFDVNVMKGFTSAREGPWLWHYDGKRYLLRLEALKNVQSRLILSQVG